MSQEPVSTTVSSTGSSTGSSKGSSPAQAANSVTLKICHRVKPSARSEYEAWLRRIIQAASQYPGHQGVHILRPTEGQHDFEIALRFASSEEAARWLESEERQALVRDILPAFRQEEEIEISSGIDYWFHTAGAAPSKQPVRWKQWVVTTAVIWPLTMLVPFLWAPIFEAFPLLSTWGIRHGFVAATIVGLVVYVVMPRVVRLVAPWMFR
ncbi:MAG: antibiotic biosynthesis monooxygenase [Halomonadaceae bacterium]|uniref:Antibiotic biosynthesis monooxygenase n=1 Tax=Halomonas colorata TaxID=2742615 RepID=A0ABR9G1R7_9GAMM|nr:antibiotic biosynthesis monooxygenase [Halomonas colorata]MBE0464831.1 antibiotic biosynthesis monooxygenase [Halomonas colorata]